MVVTLKERTFNITLQREGTPALRVWNIGRRKDIEHMIREGKTYSAIAEALDINASQVSAYAKRMGIRSKNKPMGRKRNREGYRIEYRRDNDNFVAFSTLTGKRVYIGIYETELQAKTAAIVFNMKIKMQSKK